MPIKIFIPTFLILLFFLIACNQNRQNNTEDIFVVANKPVMSAEEKLQDRFINKKLESVNTVLFDGKTIDDKKIILIYTGFDCLSCVDKGYLILKLIQSQKGNPNVYIVSTNANIGGDQERNSFYDFVYNDTKELIRSELRFLYTPVILVLDKNNHIIHLNFPKTDTKEQDIVEQIQNAILN